MVDDSPPRRRSLDHHADRLALTLAAGVLVIWAAAMALTLRAAALPTSASGTMLAVFEPGTPQEMQFVALINAGGRPLRTTWLPFVWVVAEIGRAHV